MTPPAALRKPSYDAMAANARAPERAASAKRDLLGMRDLGADLPRVLAFAKHLKGEFKAGRPLPLLAGKSAIMIFEKASTRTRVSFEVGLNKLGASATFLSARDIQMGRGESIEDTALVLSRYADLLIYRAYRNEDMAELSRRATIPVINALDDLEHPCQILADLQTVEEHKGRLAGLRFLYIGDGNNMCHSYLLGCAMAGMHVTICAPEAYAPDAGMVAAAARLALENGGSLTMTSDPDQAFKDQDVVATDTWVSMGDEAEKEERVQAFQGYTVTEERMQEAAPGAIFLHCLPAYYGYEVTKEVAHGPRSVIFDEAENRMWAQMAAMVWLLAPQQLP
ncbi:MAG TPA: ornithine carbamoyltransferase [Candidatus Thermoplasmatota archaeon]|nr:ornithine carbamoyltransferase [Candidatus Thermoplasmatota archaeon]